MKRKSIMALAILLMSIGFAAVSATLYLNGTIGIGTNNDDFDVYFSKAVENGVENNSLIQDKTHLAFRTELSKINEKYTLEYDVTNASKQYDASIVINCTGGNEYLRVENKFNVVEDLKARTTRSGKLTLTVIKSVFEENEVSINCEIRGSAKERTEAGGETIDKEQVDYLRTAGFSSTIYLGHELNKSKVESITLKNTKEVPNNAIKSWDVSNSGNGSIMAYTLDEDNNELLELYIGQNGGVNANPNSTYLFHDFTTATRIDCLEYLDTSNVTDMFYMFNNCSNLTTLDVSGFDTSKVTNMSFMFNNCSNLTTLDVSGFDTSKVTDMSYMFNNCRNLTTLDVSGFDTSKVTEMRGMFNYCSNLTTLDVSGFDTSNVTSMEDMFNNCSNLTALDVSGFDTSKVTEMRGMFSGCSNLTKLDVSRFDTSKVTDMSYMFNNCRNLTTLDVSGFDTSKVTEMRGMFNYCSNLTTLDVSRFDTSKVTEMFRMFDGCSKLTTTITIRGTECTSMAYMFRNSATLEGSQIIVNYTEDASSLVDQMIATKSSNSNVVKGKAIEKYTITIQDKTIVSDYTESYDLTKITLSSTEEGKVVTSFKLNGVTINGNTFKMPNEDVVITDVTILEMVIIESEHNPYPNSLNDQVYGEKTFEGATSLTVTLDYQTESVNYDWIYLYDSTGKQYGKYGGSRKTETITIPGDYIKIVFRTDGSGNNYYGFKATITPNYD